MPFFMSMQQWITVDCKVHKITVLGFRKVRKVKVWTHLLPSPPSLLDMAPRTSHTQNRAPAPFLHPFLFLLTQQIVLTYLDWPWTWNLPALASWIAGITAGLHHQSLRQLTLTICCCFPASCSLSFYSVSVWGKVGRSHFLFFIGEEPQKRSLWEHCGYSQSAGRVPCSSASLLKTDDSFERWHFSKMITEAFACLSKLYLNTDSLTKLPWCLALIKF